MGTLKIPMLLCNSDPSDSSREIQRFGGYKDYSVGRKQTCDLSPAATVPKAQGRHSRPRGRSWYRNARSLSLAGGLQWVGDGWARAS